MKRKRHKDQKCVISFDEFDLHYVLVWNKKKKNYVTKLVWAEDNFTCRDHYLGIKQLRVWEKQVSDFIEKRDHCEFFGWGRVESLIVLELGPHVHFEVQRSEVAKLSHALNSLINSYSHNVGK